MEFTRDGKFALSPLVDENGHHYSEAPDGYIAFGDVALNLLDQQTQYASRYVDGVVQDSPNLGGDLRFNADTRDYHSLGIHPEDIEEFIRRVYAWRAYRQGYITDDAGNLYQLEDS